MRKELLFLILLFSGISTGYSQNRTSTAPKEVVPEYVILAQSDTITGGIFWRYNKENEYWVEVGNTNELLDMTSNLKIKRSCKNISIEKKRNKKGAVLYDLSYNQTVFKNSGYGDVKYLHVIHSVSYEAMAYSHYLNIFGLCEKEFCKLKQAIVENDSTPVKIHSSAYKRASRGLMGWQYSKEQKGVMWFCSTSNDNVKVVRFSLPRKGNYSKKDFLNNYIEIPYSEFIKLYNNL